MHGGTPKCFVEELPKDTLVVGMYAFAQATFGSPTHEVKEQREGARLHCPLASLLALQ